MRWVFDQLAQLRESLFIATRVSILHVLLYNLFGQQLLIPSF